jgi:hypothetical protein
MRRTKHQGPVAQWIRASACGAESHWFESSQDHLTLLTMVEVI